MRYNRNTRTRKYRRELKMKRRRRLFYLLVAIIVAVICYFAYRGISNTIARLNVEKTEEVPTKRVYTTQDIDFPGRYSETFNDIQEVQIVAAEAAGITPLTTSDSVAILLREGQLVSVNDTTLYSTEEADLPYLVPLAKDLLDEIATRYQLASGKTSPLRLTSCLRTNDAISKLMRRNRNSVKNSCHLYGTTFDISYRFMEQTDKDALARVLYQLQQGGYCYVKYERKQPCFHITVIP